jgi:uncharacterized repeat protein (TIGR03803 family)
MGRTLPVLRRSTVLLAYFMLVALAGSARSQSTLKVLHTFGGYHDGYDPDGALTFDNAGNLYGTAAYGPGAGCDVGQGCGIAFKLKPNLDGSWSEDVLHFFDGADGATPVAGLAFDARGNLYGNTYRGGIADYGTVFKLTSRPGDSWVFSNIHSFASPASGVYPVAGVSFDNSGRLYGTTSAGGLYTNGIAYNLEPVSPSNWYEIPVHAFGAPGDGSVPYGGLIFDAAGNAYGTTNQGGANGVGTVFQLTRSRLNFGWTETVLYSFKGRICSQSSDGAGPAAGLTFDSAGDLYGTTQCGGAGGYGTVFKLTHNPDDTWTESILYAFQGGNDGANPTAPVTFDSAGNLYGTTVDGGPLTDGTIYKLTLANGSWTESVLHAFSYTDGAAPASGVILDAAGNLYGTASSGGTNGPSGGVAYEFIP